MKKQNDDWMQRLMNSPEAKKEYTPDVPFDKFVEKVVSHNPKNDVSSLTLEECAGINKNLFKSKKSYSLKEVIDRIEDNFEKGRISEEVRAEGIAAFNRLAKSNFVRREGAGAERRYIYEDFWM
jgi:hypothetical protein